jgi:hypothetical protein
VERENDPEFHPLRSDARRTLGCILLLASPNCRTFAPSSFLRDLHLQTIIMFYIVTAGGESLHWVPLYRSSIRVVDVNPLQQQRRSFDGNAFSSSAIDGNALSSSGSLAYRELYIKPSGPALELYCYDIV